MKHGNKMIAPIIITILVVIYYVVFFGFIIVLLPGIILKIVLGAIPVIFAIAMIVVCKQRIDEIKGGEEDDLSEY